MSRSVSAAKSTRTTVRCSANSPAIPPLLHSLLLAGGFFAAVGLNPGLVYAQVAANTLPTGGTVARGDATVGTAGIAANGRNTLAINQNSTAAVLNWSSFNVGSNCTVSFQQPANGVALGVTRAQKFWKSMWRDRAHGKTSMFMPGFGKALEIAAS